MGAGDNNCPGPRRRASLRIAALKAIASATPLRDDGVGAIGWMEVWMLVLLLVVVDGLLDTCADLPRLVVRTEISCWPLKRMLLGVDALPPTLAESREVTHALFAQPLEVGGM
eukprot:scaffold163508_cov27-Tisochrysis_lutea.AAC.8